MTRSIRLGLALGAALSLSACWGSDTSGDPRVAQVVDYVKTHCGWVVQAASVYAMLNAPDPAVQGTIAVGNAICQALNTPTEVNTLFGWGEDKPCPRVNGVCIEASRDVKE